MKSRTEPKEIVFKRRSDTVKFLLEVPRELWEKFIRTVPISRTRHDFILDLIQRRVAEYEEASGKV